MCGVQATMNVMTGERYKMVPKEIKGYCRGMYGMPPGKISDELMQKALGNEKPEFKRPGDLLEPGIEPARQGCAGLARTWEDVLTYALFPNEATEFLKIKYGV